MGGEEIVVPGEDTDGKACSEGGSLGKGFRRGTEMRGKRQWAVVKKEKGRGCY